MTSHEATSWDLTAAQQHIWYAQGLDPDSPVYNMSGYIEIDGDLNVDLFVQAVRRSADEVEAYRLNFTENDGVVRQHINSKAGLPFCFYDASSQPDPRDFALRWMLADTGRPMSLNDDHLLVLALFKLAPGSYIFYQRSHHIAVDAFSIFLFVYRASQVYAALLSGDSHALEEEALGPIRTLIEADAAYRSSEQFSHDREYWAGVLAGRPEAVNLSGGPRSRMRRVSMQHVEVVDAAEAAELRRAARRLKLSFPGLMFAAAAILVHRVTNAEDFILGVPVLGRDGREQYRTPGMTANILPVRCSAWPWMSVGQLAECVSGQVRGALRHRRYRYEEMLRDLKAVGQGNLFSLIVNAVPFDYSMRFGDCGVVPYSLTKGSYNDISIFIYDKIDLKGTLQLAFDVDPDVYDMEATRRHAHQFRQVLSWIAGASPGECIGRAEIIDDAERRQFLAEGRGAGRRLPEVTLPELFEAQVARTPNAVAVVSSGGELTYAELNARADRLAMLLKERGVGPEALVAVLLERSAALVVAPLAVLKAGGAYLAIDPGYPAERIAYMLRDARPAVVVSSRAGRACVHLPLADGPEWLMVDDPQTAARVDGIGRPELAGTGES
jgi:Condensation domain/AMP-binding enzyme